MTAPTALLTFGIGPVHEFIAAARRVADVWAGSDLLSHLMGQAVQAAGGGAVFPDVAPGTEPTGLPNRVVVRVPLDRADAIAEAMARAVEERWSELAEGAVAILRRYGIEPSEDLWPAEPGPDRPRQTDRVFDLSWSWVAEGGHYVRAAQEGARRYAATRLFRPFEQVEQDGEKCALCGARTALPDGDRTNVRRAWQEAEERAKAQGEDGDERFFRFDQGRLCLVCATKRLYTHDQERKVYFIALTRFDEGPEAGGESDGSRGGARGSDRKGSGSGGGETPSAAEGPARAFIGRVGKGGAKGDEQARKDDERRRYVAVVAMDGDRMSRILSLGEDAIVEKRVESFHRELSQALSRFARGLRKPVGQRDDPLTAAQLDLRYLELDGVLDEGRQEGGGSDRRGRSDAYVRRPQLLYAGGDDVLVVCSPADALPVARAIRSKFLAELEGLRSHFRDPRKLDDLTLSGAIVFAHSKHPAGLLFREANELLKRKAKGESGRDSLAIKLIKRSGVPVEVAFRWQEGASGADSLAWIDAMDGLARRLRTGTLSSSQTFNLRQEETVLRHAFGTDITKWIPWLTDRLSRGQATSAEARELARRIAPFFAHDKAEALRIVRFLGVEVKS